MRPMLASLAPTIPTGAGWMHEIKWDGMRVLADVRAEGLCLTSRTGREVTSSFPELAGLCSVAPDVLLDGEVLVLADGVPSFSALGRRMHVVAPSASLVAAAPVTYVIFDLLRLDGHDVTPVPLADRRRLLEALDLAGPSWHLSPRFDDGAALLAATREQGLEGVMSKRLDARYEPGVRSTAWLKTPHRPTESYVVGGWRSLSTGSAGLGAVLVGTPSPDGLRYRGRTGSGLVGAAGADLLAALVPRADSPFAEDVPRVDAAGTTWVEPLVVVDIASLGPGPDGRLRQPAYQRRRPDLTPSDLSPDTPTGSPVSPTTEGSPVSPTTEGSPVSPTTEGSPVSPTTERSPVPPTTEGRAGSPTTEGSAGSPTTERSPVSLSTEGRAGSPTTEGSAGSPTTERSPVSPTTEGRAGSPTTEGSPVSPTTEGNPAPPTARRAGASRVSNPDKVMYPASGTTKGEVADYYAAVADRLLPQLADRPVTRIRWPHGVGGPHFFEKNVPSGLPEQVARVTLPSPGSTKNRDLVTYPLLRTVDDLLVMANLGALELHTPQWRVVDGAAAHPDRLVVDLDPGPPAGLAECAVVALLVRERLAALGFECEPVTSGSKGLQLYAPLDGVLAADEVREIARLLAELLAAERPDLVLSSMRRDLRPGKVLVDWSQNSASKTTITPWSLRGRERPTVACPRTWDEVAAGAAGEPFEQVLLTDALTR